MPVARRPVTKAPSVTVMVVVDSWVSRCAALHSGQVLGGTATVSRVFIETRCSWRQCADSIESPLIGRAQMTGPRSPLNARPLRNPGQSLDEEIQEAIDDQATSPFIAIAGLWVVAGVEWFGAWRDLPRQPWWFTIAALAATGWLAWRVYRVREHVGRLKARSRRRTCCRPVLGRSSRSGSTHLP